MRSVLFRHSLRRKLYARLDRCSNVANDHCRKCRNSLPILKGVFVYAAVHVFGGIARRIPC